MARQTKERAEQTREALIDAGALVFYRHGVARASLEEVARVSGVTRGAVYWHFRGKHELFAAVEERLRKPQRADLDEILALGPSKDPLHALQMLVERILMELATNETTRMLWTVVLLRIDCAEEDLPALKRQAEHQRHFQQGLQQFFDKIVPAPRRGSDWQPDTAAAMVFTLVQGTILRALRFPDEYPIESVGLPVIRSFMEALRRNWIRLR